MIIARTPFRISLLGGGTDFPNFYNYHIGMTLGSTINRYAYITVDYAPKFVPHRYRVVYSRIEEVATVAEIQHPAVRATLQYLGVTDGVEIHHASDLPARSGMGGSSSFVVGLLAALYGARGEYPTAGELAKDATHIERDILGEPVGSQDQILTAHGGMNQIVWHPTGNVGVRQIKLPPKRLAQFHSRLLLFHVGARPGERPSAGQSGVDVPRMQRLAGMVREGTAILESGNLDCFGPLLDESWQLKRQLWGDVSSPRIDAIYAKGLAAGATGGKLLGAGGGGFMLLFAAPERHDAVKAALAELIHVPFEFENRGCEIIVGRG